MSAASPEPMLGCESAYRALTPATMMAAHCLPHNRTFVQHWLANQVDASFRFRT
jgi:hypothetical protein